MAERPPVKPSGASAALNAKFSALPEIERRWSEEMGLNGIGSGFLAMILANQVWRAVAHGAAMDEADRLTTRAAAEDALRGIGPRDATEGLLAAQMVATHEAAMECFRRAMLDGQTFEGRQANLGQANKLVRSYAALLEALDRHRGKGQPQVVRVERVTVEAGGQAIVGAVTQGGGGSGAGSDERPHAPGRLAHEPGEPLRGKDTGREPVPVAGGAGEEAVPDARRDGG